MVVCESGFWRWMVRVSVGAVRGAPGGLVWAIRAVPGMVRAIRKPRIMEAIRDPFCEFYTGMMALFIFPMVAAVDLVASDPYLTSTTRIAVALLAIPSFLLMMHGIYRGFVRPHRRTRGAEG